MRFIFKDVLKVFHCGVPTSAQVNKYLVGKDRPRPRHAGPEGSRGIAVHFLERRL